MGRSEIPWQLESLGLDGGLPKMICIIPYVNSPPSLVTLADVTQSLFMKVQRL